VSAVAVPLKDPIRLANLARAQQVRLGHAQLRRDIKAMRKETAVLHVANLLREGEPPTLKIGWLLTSVPQVGRKKALGFLRKAAVYSMDRHVGDLTQRQRDAVADELEDWHAYWVEKYA
jgi:hypothetical protein